MIAMKLLHGFSPGRVQAGRLLLAGLLLSFSAVPATAYILRGPHIIDLMVRQLGSADTLQVSQRASYYGDAFEKGVVEARETVRYVFPHMFRSDSVSKHAERIRVQARGKRLTIVDGRVAAGREYPFDTYKDLLLYRSKSLLSKRLSHLGVDTRASSFERFEDRIVLVLGTESPDETVRQVWADKETFMPVRWLLPGKDDQGRGFMREVRYLDWRRVNSVWYPMHMQFIENGRLLREIRVERMKVNATFPKELFDTARLRAEHAVPDEAAGGGAVAEELNEVEETINEFRKKYE